ncbi:uncharacterized protein DSM5745_06414 [Aspergillus mulundensis]|uniref:Homeobox domain-containing protein n=1 Tax=Aspergillus mulundensis TaxID=1810919 RepID=A0A3D8RQQ9_9EURO|nr:Uncharacterized protein DSM5745_06414 [Aspergillus mulundensis]RDW76422.1 Uncharacterized protein DSM5745_06414 [Aspergillus mulundensis]
MNYIHHPYQFTGHPGVPMEQHLTYDPTMVHPTMMHHPMDGYLYAQPPFDMVDYYHQPLIDYEEYAENLSRPRLTKEQVETLEAQFQAHPKPSSNVKRQLAQQTHLSLPRVANWFQNRRAKAKQQRRQEEYERMQKAKAEAEEAVKVKSEPSDTSFAEASDEQKQDDSKVSTPKASKPTSSNQDQSSEASVGSKHQPTRSESARAASLASLQRAMNAAAQYQDAQNASMDGSGSVSPTTSLPTDADSAIWSSVNSTNGDLSVPGLDNSQTLSDYRSASDAGASYNSMQYALQADVAIARRGSSDVLADSFEGIGITTSPSLSQLGNRTDRAATWKDNGKELDLAARRNRPRPAAIGTSRSSSMLHTQAMSPTTRGQSYGTVKQSKSAGNLSSRYAGVRKPSAQRSPLNLSTFSEAGVLSSAKTELSTMLQPVTTNSLAPPTPLTPEDLHHLLPNTPTTDGYCLSAQPASHLFPTTQPMQINIASPPATPLGMEMMPSYPYHGVPPPMSAPAHYTTFPDYGCDGSLQGRNWEATSMPSPEISFQNQCQQMDLSSISYEQALEQSHPGSRASGSPFCDAGMHTPIDASKATEFHLYEFPDQEEAHRFVAQQLPSQKPKAYTFAEHRTPTNFG